MAEAPSSRDLRKEFPDMPFDGFLEIIKIFGDEDPEALRELLREQNEQARLMEEERQRRLRLGHAIEHENVRRPQHSPDPIHQEGRAGKTRRRLPRGAL